MITWEEHDIPIQCIYIVNCAVKRLPLVPTCHMTIISYSVISGHSHSLLGPNHYCYILIPKTVNFSLILLANMYIQLGLHAAKLCMISKALSYFLTILLLPIHCLLTTLVIGHIYLSAVTVDLLNCPVPISEVISVDYMHPSLTQPSQRELPENIYKLENHPFSINTDGIKLHHAPEKTLLRQHPGTVSNTWPDPNELVICWTLHFLP